MTTHTREAARLAELVRGAVELEHGPDGVRAHRLPAWARAQTTDPLLQAAQSQPAGVRLTFASEATVVELDAHATRVGYRGAPLRPAGVFELAVDGAVVGRASLTEATVVMTDLATGAVTAEPAGASTLRFNGLAPGTKRVDVWLPHNETVELVALRTDAPVEPWPTTAPVWLHHGSSISQGSNAVHPSGTWPAVAATLAGADLLNLGFGGSAMVDQLVARTIRDLPADAISLKLGINVVNADAMRVRAFESAVHGFLDTVRDGHPTTPLLLVSPVLCPIHEHTPGPGAFDEAALAQGRIGFRATGDPAEVAAGRLTLTVIRDVLARVVEARRADDPHLHHLDGRELYGEGDAQAHPLPDDLHPDPATHRLMGTRFAELALLPDSPVPLVRTGG
ncbi:lipase [Cellulomonas sp. APG4]|uniref:SGNH/GDSL hydrolase family protein n=1 Tax=Cellulomonas sp. APG4 TaxID=1538656 RepID=UPI00137A0957|nr:SGNH/GDSL hydrolase family protein [Cellulomonas sp. APG4]NCT92499.1 lipase [Cellulomonas sp. APG4]